MSTLPRHQPRPPGGAAVTVPARAARQGAGPRAMVMVLLASLLLAVIAGLVMTTIL